MPGTALGNRNEKLNVSVPILKGAHFPVGRQTDRETINYTLHCAKYRARGKHTAWCTPQGMGATREGVLGAVILKPCLSATVEINQLETGKEELSKQRQHVQMDGAREHTAHWVKLGQREVSSEVRRADSDLPLSGLICWTEAFGFGAGLTGSH